MNNKKDNASKSNQQCSILGRLKSMGSSELALISLILIIVGGLVFFFFFWPANKSELDKFASCLTDSGATLYGLPTCPHCQEQKELFKDSFKYIDYIDCSKQQAKCSSENIGSVPAWDIDGERTVGVQTLEELAEKTGCELPSS